jgi:hypothetical protein
MRQLHRGESPPDFIHPIGGVFELLLLLEGRNRVEHLQFLLLVEGTADVYVDVKLIALVVG